MNLAHRCLLAGAAAVALLAGTPSCASNTNQIPSEKVVLAESERLLWQALYVAIVDEDYPLGSGANPSSRTIQSAWKLDLAPYKGEGFRTRVIASYEPTGLEPDTGLEGFDVSIRVEKETNESYQSLDPRYAKWEVAPDDAQVSRRILQRLNSYLETEQIEVSDTPDPVGYEFD